jgi:hypothetical protein
MAARGKRVKEDERVCWVGVFTLGRRETNGHRHRRECDEELHGCVVAGGAACDALPCYRVVVCSEKCIQERVNDVRMRDE